MEEIKEAKSINYPCPYCGQQQLIVYGGDYEDFTTEELKELAAEKCDCTEARAYQRRDEIKTDACAAVKELFKEETASFREFLLEGVEILANQTIKKLNVTNEDGIKATLTRKDDRIRVERSVTDKQVME